MSIWLHATALLLDNYSAIYKQRQQSGIVIRPNKPNTDFQFNVSVGIEIVVKYPETKIIYSPFNE